MENQDKRFKDDFKVISLFQRNENRNHASDSSTRPGTLTQYYRNFDSNQSGVHNSNQGYLTYDSPTHSYCEYIEDKLEKYHRGKYRLNDFYHKNQFEKQPEFFTYSDQACQNRTLYKTAETQIALTEDQTPIHQTIPIQKPNGTKSHYIDYLNSNNRKTEREKTRIKSRIHHRDNVNTIPIYKCKKHRDYRDGNNNAYYIMTDVLAPNVYCDQSDRRSRLTNYILNQSVDEYYDDESLTENFSPKPYMDFDTEMNPDEKTESIKIDLPTHYYGDGEGLKQKPEVKSRYMDFYYIKQDIIKEDKAADKYYNDTLSSNPKQSNCTNPNNAVMLNMSDDLNPCCQSIVTQRPIKSRYMDWCKDHGSAITRKEPLKTSRLDWKDYHRLHTIHKFLNDLEYNFPSLCTTGVIGSSLENRDLKVLKVSNCNVGNASVWIDAGIHAREWIAPAVNTFIINHVVKNFNQLPKSMQNKDWYFLPVMNPDGYEYSHTNHRMWRKNKASIGNECVGVDLNRNFSYGWGGKGSSDDPKSPFYHGPHPFSEPESRAVRDMLKSSGIHFKVYITLHSFGEAILFPFAYRDELCPDYIRLLQGATIMSKAINETSGNIYKVGISRDVMYGAAGTSNDWSYGAAKIPFCYLLELRSKKHKFKVPQVEIEDTGKEILNAVTELMEFVDKYDMDGRFIEYPSNYKVI